MRPCYSLSEFPEQYFYWLPSDYSANSSPLLATPMLPTPYPYWRYNQFQTASSHLSGRQSFSSYASYSRFRTPHPTSSSLFPRFQYFPWPGSIKKAATQATTATTLTRKSAPWHLRTLWALGWLFSFFVSGIGFGWCRRSLGQDCSCWGISIKSERTMVICWWSWSVMGWSILGCISRIKVRRAHVRETRV